MTSHIEPTPITLSTPSTPSTPLTLSTSDSKKSPKSLIKKYESALMQLTHSDLDDLIATFRLEPVIVNRAGRTGASLAKPASEFGIGLDPGLLDVMRTKSGVPRERLTDTSARTVFPRFLIEPNEKFRSAMVDSGLIYGMEVPLENHYYFQLSANGRAKISYQVISGGREVADFSPHQIARIIDVGADLLLKRDKEYAPVFAAERAKKILSNHQQGAFQEVTAKNSKSAGQKAGGAKGSEISGISESAGPPSSVIGQLQLLSLGVDTTQVRMPQSHLSNYKAIKDVMLNAGAAYQSDKDGSYFQFPQDIDAGQALAQIKAGERPNVQQETQFFATPHAVALKAIEQFGLIGGFENKQFLEPSAGDGALAKELRLRGAEITCIENWKPNVSALKAIGFEPLEEDFLKVSPSQTHLFDGILMNPPFTKGADMQHVRHALGFLRPDGELVGIMSPAFQTQSTKGPSQFKALMSLAEATITPIEKGAFKASGTGVATVQVHVRMDRLLAALDARNETGKEYGLDLAMVWEQQQGERLSRLSRLSRKSSQAAVRM